MPAGPALKGWNSMGSDSFLMIFDLISLMCGVYILYTYVKLRMACRLFPSSLLIPSGKSPKDCLDSEGYIRYMLPRLLIIGIPITLFGMVNLANEYLQLFDYQVGLIMTGVAFVFIVWFAVCTAKANRRYW